MPNYEGFLKEAVRGGVTMVQYRDKSEDIMDVRRRALDIQRILRPLGASFILNDHVELAAEIDADGVHIGQNDMHVLEARKVLGPHKIIGISIENLEELEVINVLEGLYYVTASAVFPSKTKPDCKKIWGIDGLRKVVLRSKHPVTAIGGIKAYKAKKVMDAGAVGIAVVGAIHNSPDPYGAALNLRNALEQTE
jgi:thiamine-phosphate pyrophosphorylase